MLKFSWKVTKYLIEIICGNKTIQLIKVSVAGIVLCYIKYKQERGHDYYMLYDAVPSITYRHMDVAALPFTARSTLQQGNYCQTGRCTKQSTLNINSLAPGSYN